MKKWTGISEMMRNITLLGQLGISLVAPLLLCLALCWWLCAHVGLGGWVYIPGFFFGLGGSGMSAYKVFMTVTGRQEKKEEKAKISFNSHH